MRAVEKSLDYISCYLGRGTRTQEHMPFGHFPLSLTHSLSEWFKMIRADFISFPLKMIQILFLSLSLLKQVPKQRTTGILAFARRKKISAFACIHERIYEI